MAYSEVLDRRVYLVEDDEALRRTIRRVLIGAGIYTEEFAAGEALLQAHPDLPPGCVLLDLQLAGMDGFAVLAELRRVGSALPVVMLTGNGEVQTAVRAVKAGALDYLTKPFRNEQLLEVLEGAFELIRTLAASGAGGIENLSEREKEVLLSFSDGASNKAVANQLGLSVRTVEMHRTNIVRKLKVSNLVQALFLAKDGGYIR